MENSSLPRMAIIALLITPVPSFPKDQKQLDPWLVLGRITHKRNYTIQTHDHRCVKGTIAKVEADHLTMKAYALSPKGIAQPTTVTFNRADILRVSCGHAVYYSGRSSWLDVGLIRAEGRERLQIITRIGKTLTVKSPYKVLEDRAATNR